MGKIALISDIHGNLEALTTVLEHIKEQNVDAIYCLGDVIGYGPNPAECLSIVSECSEFILMGNHEEAVLGGAWGFSAVAKEAANWTRKQLKPGWLSFASTKNNWKVLNNLSVSYTEDDFFFVHGSPLDPTMGYIQKKDTLAPFGDTPKKITDIFDQFDKACFIGHTHTPGIITEDSKWYGIENFERVWEIKDDRFICNVGSVGQPRDKDNRACYAILTEKEIFYYRLDYDFAKTQEKIRKISQLSDKLADRLETGT